MGRRCPHASSTSTTPRGAARSPPPPPYCCPYPCPYCKLTPSLPSRHAAGRLLPPRDRLPRHAVAPARAPAARRRLALSRGGEGRCDDRRGDAVRRAECGGGNCRGEEGGAGALCFVSSLVRRGFVLPHPRTTQHSLSPAPRLPRASSRDAGAQAARHTLRAQSNVPPAAGCYPHRCVLGRLEVRAGGAWQRCPATAGAGLAFPVTKPLSRSHSLAAAPVLGAV